MRHWLALAAGIIGGAAIVLFATRRVLDVVEVQGGSMAPSLLPGDRLLVEALTYRWRVPRAGEVVLAIDPRAPGRELIKRVRASGPEVDLRGDAPAASTDSRAFGTIAVTEVRWRAMLRYWPLSRFGLLPAGPDRAG